MWKTLQSSVYRSPLENAQEHYSWLDDLFAFPHKSNTAFPDSSIFIFGEFQLAPTEAWQPPN